MHNWVFSSFSATSKWQVYLEYYFIESNLFLNSSFRRVQTITRQQRITTASPASHVLTAASICHFYNFHYFYGRWKLCAMMTCLNWPTSSGWVSLIIDTSKMECLWYRLQTLHISSSHIPHHLVGTLSSNTKVDLAILHLTFQLFSKRCRQTKKLSLRLAIWRNRKVLFWCKVKYGTDAKRKFRRFQKMYTINFRHFYCMPCLSA